MAENASKKTHVNVQKGTTGHTANIVSLRLSQPKMYFIFLDCFWTVTLSARCIIPCLNGGKCKAVNKCRCPRGFRGDHCEIGRAKPPRSNCLLACKHGTCVDNVCVCKQGWYGRLCHNSK